MAAQRPMKSPVALTLFLSLSVALLSAPGQSEILWPRPGRPALVTPGGSIEVASHGIGNFTLNASGAAHPLETTTHQQSEGSERFTLSVPDALPPGAYDLTLATEGSTAVQPAAVHVVADFPESYSIGLVRAAAILREEQDQAATAGALQSLLSPAGVFVAFLLGPLAPEDAADPETAYKTLSGALAQLTVPIVLCPAQQDWDSPAYRETFGNFLYPMHLGSDAFLMLGPGLAAPHISTSNALGEAYLARRAIRASRWSVGVTTNYGLHWNPRAQITLFVDDPLDYLIALAAPVELGDSVPWGKTRILPPPEIPRATLQILDISASNIRLRQAPETKPETP